MLKSEEKRIRDRKALAEKRKSSDFVEQERLYSKEYRKRPEVKRQKVINQVRYERKKKYGLTDEDVQRLSEGQNFRCAICEIDLPNQRWVIDHCHKTGKVRGILCQHCNLGLGFFRDSSENLIKASKYLDKQKRNI